MTEPLNISRAIHLTTETELDVSSLKCWLHCVRENAPSGVPMTITNIDDQGVPQTVAIVHRVVNNKNSYLIPLTRDLTEDEAEVIVNAFDLDADFEISISTTGPEAIEKDSGEIDVDQEKYLSLCTAWAKRQHEAWMKDRTENGWTYGTSFSLKNKTHPLLRPWSELPDDQKKINLNDPQMLLDLLNEQGYMVISKTELEAVLKLIRTS